MVNGEGVLVLGRDRLARVLSATSHERSLVATVKPAGYNFENPNDVWLFVDTRDFRWSDYEVEGEGAQSEWSCMVQKPQRTS